MTFTHVMAGALVSDLATAEAWYTELFETAPQARPMEGLLEWYLPDGSGVQVYQDPTRAGSSSLVLSTSDLNATASRLHAASITDHDIERGGGARILRLHDVDGNSVVITGT